MLFAQDVTGAGRMGQLVVNCLAVGGGYLIGWFLVALLTGGFDRFVIRRKSPAKLHSASRNTGGLALAVLVAIIVFGHGQGWTLFGGGGPGSDNGTSSVKTVVDTGENKKETKPDSVPISIKELPPIDERIRVLILGGDEVKAERFYIVEDAAGPKTFAEAMASIIAKRDAAAGKRVGVEIRFSAKNALPQDHPAVTRLARWIRTEANLSVTFPAE
ncbi:MAG: hypothetical protein U0798_06960 [Gemmataceae bacterium]